MPDNDLLARIQRDFTYHPPATATVVRLHEDTRRDFRSLAFALVTRGPTPSRELSLALTALEEACFWANANIARNSHAD